MILCSIIYKNIKNIKFSIFLLYFYDILNKNDGNFIFPLFLLYFYDILNKNDGNFIFPLFLLIIVKEEVQIGGIWQHIH